MRENSRENCNSKISNITDCLFFLLTMVVSAYIYIITRYSLTVLGFQQLNNFIVIFLSILIEALPFILIGILLASIIEVYVSDEIIQRVILSNTATGLLAASLVGLIFPVCECGIIPVARKMIKKGAPAHIAITFMLAVPIVNPVVIASTLFAFSENNIYVILRIGIGILVTISIGYLTQLFFDKSNILKSDGRNDNSHSSCCSYYSHHSHYNHINKIKEVMEHATEEFFEVGKYLIIGALLASIIQIFVPRSINIVYLFIPVCLSLLEWQLFFSCLWFFP